MLKNREQNSLLSVFITVFRLFGDLLYRNVLRFNVFF